MNNNGFHVLKKASAPHFLSTIPMLLLATLDLQKKVNVATANLPAFRLYKSVGYSEYLKEGTTISMEKFTNSES